MIPIERVIEHIRHWIILNNLQQTHFTELL